MSTITKYDKSIFMMDCEELYNFFVDFHIVYQKLQKKLNKSITGQITYHSLLELYSNCNDKFVEEMVLKYDYMYMDLHKAFIELENRECKGYCIQILWMCFNDYDITGYKYIKKYPASSIIDKYLQILRFGK